MSTIPTNNTTSGSNAIITFDEVNSNSGLTLSSSTGVCTTLRADGSGNLMITGSVDASLYKSVTFSKADLETKIKEFHAGKYTRKYMEIFLDFMVMNAMLDNLEYLEYKVQLDKELSK